MTHIFKKGDNILTSENLDTFITKIEGEKIYFLDEDKIEKWKYCEDIKLVESKQKNKQMEQKMFKINCGIYPFEIYVFISGSDFILKTMKSKVNKKSYKELINIFNNSAKHSHSGEFIINLENQMIIHLRNEISTIQDLTILNHELLHAVFAVHRIIQSDLTHSSEESYTYLYEHLCKQIYKEINLKILT